MRDKLADPATERWVSPISVWEIGSLACKKRIQLNLSLDAWVAETRSKAPWQEAPLTMEVALASGRLQLHGDPADRFLAVTDLVYGLTLVTADQLLLRLESIDHLAN